MSTASDFEKIARTGAVYEVVGASGAAYIIFWFDDGSVVAAQKRPAGNKAAARIQVTGTSQVPVTSDDITSRGTHAQS